MSCHTSIFFLGLSSPYCHHQLPRGTIKTSKKYLLLCTAGLLASLCCFSHVFHADHALCKAGDDEMNERTFSTKLGCCTGVTRCRDLHMEDRITVPG